MDKQQKLEEIAEQVEKCRKCGLYKTATQAVPGEGDPNAKIMFAGEGPGFWEDKKGRPFVGQAGKLLDELLSAKVSQRRPASGMGGSASGGQLINLSRKNIFITNMVKHRPPANRDPLPDEIEACSIWIDKQIEIINPKIIITLGRFSMAKFLPGESISKVHGTGRMVYWNSKELMVVPMYHPAAGLRSGGILKELRNDFIKLGQY